MNIHPLIRSSLNSEQQKAAIQMKNCVVAAGAGSGKTRVLAYRFAHLIIEHGFDVDTILTLTFTKKATAQMYERIYTTLLEIASSTDSSDIHKKRANIAIENFHTSRIQTLDSYCSSIVKGSSRLYGIKPDFSIDNESVLDYSKKLALKYMLEYRNVPALQELLGMDKFENMIHSLFVNPILYTSSITCEIDFFGQIDTQIEIILHEWTKITTALFSLKDIFIESNPELLKTFTIIDDTFLDSSALQAYITQIRMNDTLQEQKKEIIVVIKKSLIPFLNAIFFLSKLHKGKKEHKSIKEEIDLLKESYSTLASIYNYIVFLPQTLSLLPILQSYQTELTEWKRASGNLTFLDVSSLAFTILKDNPEIRKSEKLKINAIMIDEFQDNNAIQKDLLYLLAENIDRNDLSIPTTNELCPEKLFFVGDEKQSIYKFRGADVSVFRELKSDLSQTLNLSTNYRSSPQLIASFNSLFGGFEYKGAQPSFDQTLSVLKKENAPSIFLQEYQLPENYSFPLFEAEYSCVYANTPKSTENIDTQRIHICLLNNTKENKNDGDGESDEESLIEAENLAIYTAQRIASLCKEGHKPQDIAILFRSYSKQYLYEKHLRRLGVPYIAENIANFFGDAPVNDILSLLRLIVYPNDTLSFLTVLCSPFVKLNHQEALNCILQSKISKDNDILFTHEVAQNLEGAAKEKFIGALYRYENLRKKAHSASCCEIVKDLWYNEGYRYETMWNKDVSLFSELYDFLFDFARKTDSDGNNLSYFVDTLYDLEKNEDRLENMNIPLERAGAVTLMSIHKSKGLEFPIVFITGISSSGKNQINTEKIYIDTICGPSFNFSLSGEIPDSNNNYFFAQSKNNEKQMNEAELRRLLYVAMTRAEKELYIIGSYSISSEVQKSLGKDTSDIHDNKSTEKSLFDILNTIFTTKVTDKKKNKNTSQVQFDYCIQNDTLFAFLLPTIIQYNSNNAPFTLEQIEKTTREDLLLLDNARKKESLKEVQSRVLPIYNTATLIHTPIIESPYKSPSHLVHTNIPDHIKNDNYDNGENAIKELDDIIVLYNENQFTYSHFGTLCHAYAESLFTKKAPKIPNEIQSNLKIHEVSIICDIAQQMIDTFSKSYYGKEALDSKWKRTEHDFKLKVTNNNKRVFINGQIDLLYERNDGSLVIVDYKTDSVENPTIHYTQIAAYSKAVSTIYARENTQIVCILYYLRSGNAVDVSKEINDIDIKSIVF